MSVPTAYLMSTKNTKLIFESMQKASLPTKGFTHEFLKNMGYSSSGDRPIIPVLKAIGFLDQTGMPTQLYRDYKDPATAGRALAQGLRNGYADLFAIDTEAHTKTQKELAGMFARLSEKGESVTAKMAMTFHALAGLADFSQAGSTGGSDSAGSDGSSDGGGTGDTGGGNGGDTGGAGGGTGGGVIALRHDIHVHLPLSTDVAVYDAIFKSLRENLM